LHALPRARFAHGKQLPWLRDGANQEKEILSGYQQDSICGTWELLADAVYPGGSAAIIKAGWPLPGEVKHEWADHICPIWM
ncbi:hypothetical protein M3O40_14855, partial [Xanthomonas nasturtii]|nr:hypothetical protein [Xanthomonas nasturtii]MCL1504367.1 hypothetical protein [Xanthomonas nasturtii]